MSQMIDITGQRFGRLTVLERIDRKGSHGEILWMCQCDCGGTKITKTGHLRQGLIKSCNCLRNNHKKIHGEGSWGKRTVEFNTWQRIKYRCYNPKAKEYSRYGGRGIRVCDRWLGKDGFLNFLQDMGRRPSSNHSLDRYPSNDGDYEPTNCRWATRKEQMANSRQRKRIENFTDIELLTEVRRRDLHVH